MILKRPYAFLIRHFRLIHLIIAIPLIYISRKSRLVVNFFNEYVRNSYTFQTGSDVGSTYIGGLVLFSVIVIIIAALTIYYLLRYKEKPVKMYVFLIVYYAFLFVILFYLSGVISKMSREILEIKTARFYRDLSILIYVPQYIFVVFVALRAVGFNIKQMNFQSDLKEMEITTADNEEIEVGFELNGYKTKRFFRRFKREFGYYVVENKFAITTVLVILLFSGILVYYNTRENYNVSYSLKKQFVHQGFTIQVEDSIVSNIDYKGRKIADGNYYLAVKMKVKNSMDHKEKLDYSNFTIINNNDEPIRPKVEYSVPFSDYGEAYQGEYIRPGEEREIVLAYKLKEKDIKKDYVLKVLSSYRVTEDNLITKYAIVDLNSVIVDEVSDSRISNINNRLVLSNTNVGNTILNITEYYYGTSYIYEKSTCDKNEVCSTTKEIVTIDYTKAKGPASMLVLKYDFDLDHDTAYAKHIKSDLQFFEDFGIVNSCKGEVCSEYNLRDITPKDLKNQVVLQVDGDITNSDTLELWFVIRNKKYVISIKSAN